MAKTQKRQVSFTTPGTDAAKRPVSRPGSEFNPDYGYVKHDLKLMAYQVLFFIGALIVLTFILH
jgi:hypothetical protein